MTVPMIDRALCSARALASVMVLATKEGKDHATGRTFLFVPHAELVRAAGVLPQAGLSLRARNESVSEWGLAVEWRLTHTDGEHDDWSTVTPLSQAVRPELAVAWARSHALSAVIRSLLLVGASETPDPCETGQDKPVETRGQAAIQEDARRAKNGAASGGQPQTRANSLPDRNERGEKETRKAIRSGVELADAQLRAAGVAIPPTEEELQEAERVSEALRLAAIPPSPTAAARLRDGSGFLGLPEDGAPIGATDPRTEVIARPTETEDQCQTPASAGALAASATGTEQSSTNSSASGASASEAAPEKPSAPAASTAACSGSGPVSGHAGVQPAGPSVGATQPAPLSPSLVTKGEGEATPDSPARGAAPTHGEVAQTGDADAEFMTRRGETDHEHRLRKPDDAGPSDRPSSPPSPPAPLPDSPETSGTLPVAATEGVKAAVDEPPATDSPSVAGAPPASYDAPPARCNHCGVVMPCKCERCAECDSVLVEMEGVLTCTDEDCAVNSAPGEVERTLAALVSPSPSQVSLVSKAASRVSTPSSWEPGAAWLKCPKKKARTNKGRCKATGCGKDVEPGDKFREGMPVPSAGHVVKRRSGKPEGVMHEKCLASLMAESLDPKATTGTTGSAPCS